MVLFRYGNYTYTKQQQHGYSNNYATATAGGFL